MIEVATPHQTALPRNESEAIRILQDPMWRLRNLYTILDKGARKIPFRPNEAQETFLREFGLRNIILKARQLGFSTLWDLMELDQCVFLDNIHAGIVAHELESAQTIFRDKVKLAWDELDPMIHEMRTTVGNSKTELAWDNGSSLRVSTSVRSTTLQWLHVSEFGKICAKYPHKAREVLTGSLPAVPDDGFVCIESTAEGREGAYYSMATEAQRLRESGILAKGKEFRFHFFGWSDHSEYRASEPVEISDKDCQYFDSIETKTGRKIDAYQRTWYVATRRTTFQGDAQLMKQEYPSVPEEAFEQSTEGCYYVNQMTAARKDGRIGHVPFLPGFQVNTFWDIGRTDGTAIWFHQWVNGHDRFIRFFEGWDEPYSYYVAEMQRHNYVWGTHYLPHDADHHRQGATDTKSAKEMLEDLGLRNIKIVPPIDAVILGIQQTRNRFPSAFFDATHCDSGIKHLDLYRKEWDTIRGCWKDKPYKDSHTEAADALRQWAQGFDPSPVVKRPEPSARRIQAMARPF